MVVGKYIKFDNEEDYKQIKAFAALREKRIGQFIVDCVKEIIEVD